MKVTDRDIPYPRLCAHRGYSAAVPENSLPAFQAALEIGAQEIEFDVQMTADHAVVAVHDFALDPVSNGTGYVWEHTLEELRQLDFGFRFGQQYRGLRIPTLEDVLQAFGNRIIMNIEVKAPNLTDPLPETYLRNIVETIRRYDCTDSVYLMCGNDAVTEQLLALAPDILVACAGGGTVERRWQIVERAIRFGCQKIQFHKACMTEEMIRLAHSHGIRCNVFWSDDPEETARFLQMGVDTILANDCGAVAPVVFGAQRGANHETR